MTQITIEISPDEEDQIVVDVLTEVLENVLNGRETCKKWGIREDKASRKIDKHLRKVIKYFSVPE